MAEKITIRSTLKNIAVPPQSLWDVFGEHGDRHRQQEIKRISRSLPKRTEVRPPLRGGSLRQWNRLYLDLIVALAQSLPSSPEGLCHLARDIANVAFMEQQTRQGGAS